MRGCILQVYCKMQFFFFFYKLIIAVKFRFLKAPHNWWKKLPEKQKYKSATPMKPHIATVLAGTTIVLMLKMTQPCYYHGKVILFAIFNWIFIADGAAWLNERRNACCVGNLYTIIKRKKGIAAECCTGEVKIKLLCLIDWLAQRINAGRLPAALTNKLFIFYQCNGVAL